MPFKSQLKKVTEQTVRAEMARAFQYAALPKFLESCSFINMDSNQDVETYAWLSTVDGFREWIGPRQIKEMKEYSLTIQNKRYENTLTVSKEDIDYDRISVVQAGIDGFVGSAEEHWYDLAVPLLNGATTNPAYDGQAFFSASHTHGSDNATVSNILTYNLSSVPVGTDYKGTVGKPSAAVMAYAIQEAIMRIMEFRTPNNRYLNRGAEKFVLVTGLAYGSAVLQAVSDIQLFNGQGNVLRSFGFDIEVRVEPAYSINNSFSIFRADGIGAAKPFIMQQRGAVELTYKDKVHEEYRHEWGLTVKRGAGYGLWQHAVLTTIAA